MPIAEIETKAGRTNHSSSDLPNSETKSYTDRRVGDWPGEAQFAELGDFKGTIEVKGVATTLCVGIFECKEESLFFLASSRPLAIGDGDSIQSALHVWFKEMESLRQIAKTLKHPLGAATENDLHCLKQFYGGM